MSVSVDYADFGCLHAQDPKLKPCRVFGKYENIKKTTFDQLSKCLAPRVTEEVYIINKMKGCFVSTSVADVSAIIRHYLA